MKINKNKIMASYNSDDVNSEIVEALMDNGYSFDEASELVDNEQVNYYPGTSNGDLGCGYMEQYYGDPDAFLEEIQDMVTKKYGISELGYAINIDWDSFGLTLQTNYGGFIPTKHGWCEIVD